MNQNDVTVYGETLRQKPFGSIQTRLIFYFCLLFVVILVTTNLICIVGVPFTSYAGRQGQKKTEVFRSLKLIAELKEERLLRWIKELHSDAWIASENDFTVTNVLQLLEAIREFSAGGREDAELWVLVRQDKGYKNLVKYLDNIISVYGVYNEILIADSETGTIIVSTDDADVGGNISQQPFFTGVLGNRDDYLSDIKLNPQSQQPTFQFSHVIKGKEGEVVAVLVMEVNVDDIIKPMLHTGEGLGERGEALLVNKDVKILTSLKHPLADGSTAKPLEYQIKAKPAVLAASGEEGIIETKDYRGELVLAAYRYIRVTPEWGWGMVVKRDAAELFAPLRQDIIYTSLIGLVGILVVIGLIIVIARSLTRSIVSLNQTAHEVAEGNLDARASVSSSDEVGFLATTFNSMLQRIQNWHNELDDQVNVRTTELNKTNEELRKEIAERKKVEKELWENTERLLKAQRVAKMGFLDWNLKTNEMIWSDQVYDLYGIDKQSEKSNIDLTMQLVHPDDLEFVEKNLEMAIKGEKEYDIDHRKLCSDGEVIWVHAQAELIRDADGNPESLLGTVVDITERKQAEEALRESEEKYKTLVESTTDFIFMIDKNNKVLSLNKAAARILGKEPEEIIGLSIVDLFPKEIAAGYSKNLKKVFETDKSAFDDSRMVVGERESWISVNLSPVRYQNEKIGAVMGVTRDITERKRAEEKILIANERLHYLLSSSSAVIYTAKTSGDYRATFISENVTRMVGYEAREFLENSSFWLNRVHPDDVHKVNNEVPLIFEKELHTYEYRFKRKDGKYIWVRDNMKLVRDEEGNPIEIIGFWADITERVRAEEQIKVALAEKEVLLREIQHRVKNNLQALISLIDMQVERVKDMEAVQVLIDLQGRIWAMSLVNEKLFQAQDLSRIDFGDYLKDLMANLFSALGVGRDILIHVDAAELFIDINIAIPCGLLVNELVTNAFKHAFPEDRDKDREIRVEFKKKEGDYILVVSDNGIGLPPEFDWRKAESLGLKLVNVWATRQLGGSIELDTQSGTAFTIKFADRKERS